MSDFTDPLDPIKEWQAWYRSHKVVAEMDEPQVAKDSRENLHDTSNATDTLPNWREHYAELIADQDWRKHYTELTGQQVTEINSNNMVYQQKAKEYFADTICEFFNEMSGEELFNCFYQAAKTNLEHVQKEYDKAKDLIDAIEGKNRGKK